MVNVEKYRCGFSYSLHRNVAIFGSRSVAIPTLASSLCSAGIMGLDALPLLARDTTQTSGNLRELNFNVECGRGLGRLESLDSGTY